MTLGYVGWLVYPKRFRGGKSKINKSILNNKNSIKTLVYSKLPETGEICNASFSYMFNNGEFMYHGKNDEEIENDINLTIENYQLEISEEV